MSPTLDKTTKAVASLREADVATVGAAHVRHEEALFGRGGPNQQFLG